MFKLPFLRSPQHDEEPLVVAMTGARLGDSVLFAGRSLDLVLPLAARTGLSGRLVALAGPAEGARLEGAASRQGLLLEVAPEPPAGAAFDLAVLEAEGDWARIASRVRGAVRSGGRVIVVAGRHRTGLSGLFGGGDDGPPAQEIVATLERAGWQRARPVGEREGLRFAEAFA
jgi:hypothetical protein